MHVAVAMAAVEVAPVPRVPPPALLPDPPAEAPVPPPARMSSIMGMTRREREVSSIRRIHWGTREEAGGLTTVESP